MTRRGTAIVAAVLLVAAPVLAACSGGDEAGAGNARGPDGAGAADRAPAADCDPARPATRTDGPHTFSFGGEARTYLLALPDDYDGRTAHPLVFSFHGFASDKEGQDAYAAMAAEGTARGYIVVTPDALGEPRDWNYFADPSRADDFGFVDALVVDLGERLCIDADRVYAAGHSAGSAFTGFLQCKPPYRFAAVAMVAAFIPTTCPVDRAPPAVIVFHGTADPAVPYDGGSVGGGPVGIPSVRRTLAQYADAYGCGRPATRDKPSAGVERDALAGCAGGTDVVLYTIVGGTHDWPGNAIHEEATGGQAFPATDTILDFFDAHPRTG
ncbi:MAG TPA: PHB depolymerase family esterase [Acidimicrobiales bacterium]|nr:PHB depolymerase family esterase [Acidimicrobiales bacterium]